jgi:diadenosine tetraphosphatase ApaH/serine/threonine PP2A family protein phosphatase
MLTALFADVHANLAALDACLLDARERGAERFVFLGDLVGYGPDPGEVIERIRAIPEAIVVKGNHDEAVDVEPKVRDMGDVAYAAIVWTRGALSPEQRAYLAGLPLMVRVADQCFVHSSADHPERWDYVLTSTAAERSLNAAEVPYVFSGHVHEPALYFSTPAGKIATFRPTPGSPVPVPRRRHWLAIVGSTGQPRDGNPRAAYALFADAAETLTFHRVSYDHLATAERIRTVGLPELFAERLLRGGRR